MGIGRWFRRQWRLERDDLIEMAAEVCLFAVLVIPLAAAIWCLRGPIGGG